MERILSGNNNGMIIRNNDVLAAIGILVVGTMGIDTCHEKVGRSTEMQVTYSEHLARFYSGAKLSMDLTATKVADFVKGKGLKNTDISELT